MTQRYSWSTSQILAINAHLLSAEEANAGITEPWGAEVTAHAPLDICGPTKLGKASQRDFMPRLCAGRGGSCPSRSEFPLPGSPWSRGRCPRSPSSVTYRRRTGTSTPPRPGRSCRSIPGMLLTLPGSAPEHQPRDGCLSNQTG